MKKSITNNLVLTQVDANNWTHDEDGREILIAIEMYFIFFGQEGFNAVYVKDDDTNDWSLGSCEGNEELFDAFEPNLERNHDALKTEMEKFATSHNDLQNSLYGVPEKEK